MVEIAKYLKETAHLGEHVLQVSQILNSHNQHLDDLTQHLQQLFTLFTRGDELLKIVQNYGHHLKQDVDNLKGTFEEYEQNILDVSKKLSQSSEVLRTATTLLQDIQVSAGLFVSSAQSLANLAKNTEIRAYHAKEEGKGLGVIAKECLSLAHRAQQPFHNFSILLQNLKMLATPVIKELEKIITLSQRSQNLLSESLESLHTIDDTTRSLQNLILYVESNSVLTSSIKTDVSDGLDSLRNQLLRSLNMLDDMSLRCSQISALAQIADTLNSLLAAVQSTDGTDIELKKRWHVHHQMDYFLNENTKTFGQMSIGQNPPYFPETVYDVIAHMNQQIEELTGSLEDLENLRENLGAGMAEAINLGAQITHFINEAKTTYVHLNNLGNDLLSKLGDIESLISQTNRLFSKIRTLSVFARIEEGRSETHLDIIAPIVDEFITLESQTEEAFHKLAPQLQQLRRKVTHLKKENITESLSTIKSPDYSKVKLFLDDIIRVFEEEKHSVAEISRIAGMLYEDNQPLKKVWDEYEEVMHHLSELITNFKTSTSKDIPTPGIVKGKHVVSFSMPSDILTLKPDLKTDVNSHLVICNYSCGLFQFSEAAEVIPCLCEDYAISADGTEYIFRIRKNIRYHNGHPLRVEHVRDALIRALNSPSAHFFEMISGADKYSETKNPAHVAIKILDSYTLQVKLDYSFLPILANFATSIADPYIDNVLPIGTGPFKLVSWEKNKRIVLEAHDSYFEGRPTIDELQFRVIEDEEEGYELFRKGVLSVYSPTAKSLKKLKAEMPRTLHTIPEHSIQHLCINCRKPPFDNVLVRRALAHAIDRKRLVETCLKGIAIPARGIFPPSMPVYNHRLQGYPYSQHKAQSLLKDAGYPHGLPGVYLLDVSDAASVVQRAEFVKSQLAQIGVQVEINPLPWQQCIEKTYAGESILAFRGWVSDNADPDNFLFPLFHSSSHGQTGNTFFFTSQEIDAAIETARKIRNLDQRILLYRQIEKDILDASPGIFLHHGLHIVAIQEDVLGFKPHPLGLIRAKHIYPVGTRCFVASDSPNNTPGNRKITTLAHAGL